MRKTKTIYSLFSKVSAVCMMLALLWLTISAPFVQQARENLAEQNKVEKADLSDDDDESANPYGNNTEEKAPSGNSFSEEYLHDHHEAGHLSLIASQFHMSRNAGTYIAFHGELLVPPPNKA